MKRERFLSFGCAVVMAGVMQAASFGQTNQTATTPAAQYFANRSANNAMNHNQPQAPGIQAPGMQNYAPAPQQVQISGSKPFQNVQQAPTLSPYLALDLIESSTQLPNYHAFVQPQIQQRAANESQARELQRLRQQVRVATATGVLSRNPTAGVPTTGSSSQFMNMGSYFPDRR